MGGPDFDLSFTLAPEDYRAMMRAFWRLSPGRIFRVRAIQVFSLVVAAIAAFSWWTTGEEVDLAVAIVLLLAPLGARFLNRRYYEGVFRRQRLGEAPTRVRANAEGVWKSGPHGDSRYAWTKIRRVGAARNHVLLWITPYQAVIVPNRAFADEAERGRFLEFARAKTAGQTF